MKSTFAIVKRLLASNKISFIITALVVLCATSSGDVVLSNGNYTWLLAVMTPFFFVFYDYTKLMHLGASKRDYFFGCLISYGILALSISLNFQKFFHSNVKIGAYLLQHSNLHYFTPVFVSKISIRNGNIASCSLTYD